MKIYNGYNYQKRTISLLDKINENDPERIFNNPKLKKELENHMDNNRDSYSFQIGVLLCTILNFPRILFGHYSTTFVLLEKTYKSRLEDSEREIRLSEFKPKNQDL